MPTSLGASFDFAVLRVFSRNDEKTRRTVKAVRFPMARFTANDRYDFCRLFVLWRSSDFHLPFSPLSLNFGAQKTALPFLTAQFTAPADTV